MNISCLGGVTWSNDGRRQCISGLMLNTYIDRMSNTALFKLSGSIYFKYSKAGKKKQRIFLFIYPESIQSISRGLSAASPAFLSLSFIMFKTPTLVAPRNGIFISKPQTKDLLNSICDLANATTFTIHLKTSGLPIVIKDQLRRIISIYSATNVHDRPRTNHRRANLDLLYAGRGGEVVNKKSTANILPKLDPLLQFNTRALPKIISKCMAFVITY